ncbi:MAG: tRNA 5-methoxyuridine(34)/uridine 5-oxyacetic acid(34) synthase CmoB [Methylovulum sp.]|nr:tRNA 5-methoxyuridine(34)/uridine 5-oxyacetic acid(34) synthase CmoB [Methylovulum sp.]
MLDYQPLFTQLLEANADTWAATLPQLLTIAFDTSKHADLPKWQAAIDAIPSFPHSHISLDKNAVEIGCAEDLTKTQRKELKTHLQTLHPWRKGPYQLFDIYIDTEWRSDWKWQRLQDHISPLTYRRVLDVGCGNGYHCWRMLGAGAKMVVGIDPMLLNVMQFQLIKKLHGTAPVYVLPMGIEDMPANLQLFDTVFSMGVLYHRRSPIDHLLELKGCLQAGGELILETLVIDGGLGEALMPPDRYARMRNVWFLPSCDTLVSWLQRCGFINVRVVDVTVTSVAEQRSTEWMRFHSLQDFLDPKNPQLTIEGLPAPKRAIVIANNP